jgi:Domain of unknown function (DUF4169)
VVPSSNRTVADIINLRLARKNKARDAKDKAAAENRLKFGQKKSERTLRDGLQQQAEARLDGHKRDDE